ncbi:MAG: hypothetical protein KGS72_00410 [Cyanobacteria bacterium REEB67]|nr:hypothetical protein [Cyanobacteria bacterium REEB67]
MSQTRLKNRLSDASAVFGLALLLSWSALPPACALDKETARAATSSSDNAAGAKNARIARARKDISKSAGADEKGASSEFYKGFLIQQSSPNQGAVTFYLTPQHWILRSAIFTIIVDEKANSIIAYTRQTNKYIKDSLAIGMKRFSSFRRSGDFDWGPASVIAHETWQGRKTVVIQRSGRRNDLRVKNDVVITERQVSCPSLPLSKTCQFIFTALFSQDYSQGFVLKVSRMAHSANPRYCTLRPVLAIETSTVKEKSFPASEFTLPPGLTRVKSEIDLFSNDRENMPVDSSQSALRKRSDVLNVKPRE